MMRWFAGIVLLGLVLLAVFVATNWDHLFAFPGILPGFTAKEYCSCRFVIGQTDGYCRGYVKQFLPVSELLVDESGYRVTARALLTTRSARWLARREGCRLE
jgi:hypothetical protein